MLFGAAHVTKGIEIQNNKGSQLIDLVFALDTSLQIKLIENPVAINVKKEKIRSTKRWSPNALNIILCNLKPMVDAHENVSQGFL